jgi:hypothetical protein
MTVVDRCNRRARHKIRYIQDFEVQKLEVKIMYLIWIQTNREAWLRATILHLISS